MDRGPPNGTMPSIRDGRRAVEGREKKRMQATGIKTTQTGYNKGLLGILLTAVVLAAVVTALIIVTSAQSSHAGAAASAADANAIGQSRVQFFAQERGEQSLSGTERPVPWIRPDGTMPRPVSNAGSSPLRMIAD
jgi:hypothetical protein